MIKMATLALQRILKQELREMKQKLQNAEACIERLTHGSLQQALLPQPPIPVSVYGTMTASSNFSLSEPQPLCLQVPESAILALLSCLRPVAVIAPSHDEVQKMTSTDTVL